LLKNYKGASADDRVGTICLAGNSYLLGAMLVKPFIIVWAMQKEQAHMRIACSGKVDAVACSLDGLYCAAAIKQTIYIWEVATGYLMASASRHYQNISVLKFIDDGSHLVSGGHDNLVIAWRLARLFSHSLESGGCEGHFTSHGYSGHSSSSSQLTRHVWNHHTQVVTGVHCGRGGVNCRVVTVSLDGTCKMYELLSGNLLFSLLLDHPLTAVTMDVQESSLFIGTVNGSLVQLNLFLPEVYRNSTEVNHHLNTKTYKGHSKSITRLQISSCGHVLISSCTDGCVIQWDVPSKQSIKMQINKKAVTDIILKCLPDGLTTSASWKPELLPPLKPFLKQPLFSSFLTDDVLNDTGDDATVPVGKKAELTTSKSVQKNSVPNEKIQEGTRSSGSMNVAEQGSVPRAEMESLHESLAKMREIHRKIFQFTEDSLLPNQPPEKMGKFTE
jgi:pre-rRNA-processing protein IPI3